MTGAPSVDEMFRALFVESPEPLLVVTGDPAFTIVDVTPTFLARYELTRDVIGRPVREVLPDRIELHASLERALERRAIDVMDIESSGEIHVRGRSVPVIVGGELRWIKHRIEDVADVVAINERVGGELEAFRYSVSHDLRFPLRVIEGYTRALDEDYGTQLDHQGHTYIAAIRKGVTRMEAMITRLGELLSISRAPYIETKVDVSELARDIVTGLRRRSERAVAVEIADGLVAHGDRRQIEAALEALIGNAWKFTGKTAEPRVEVGKQGDAFFVRDNGTGFDPAAPRLFAPFRRLHRAEEFPGDGVGLAIVYRVVTRHGGRVWAESTPGQGATLYFTLR